jgi:hypothetical protein
MVMALSDGYRSEWWKNEQDMIGCNPRETVTKERQHCLNRSAYFVSYPLVTQKR